MDKSCRDCPSYVHPNDVMSKVGTSYGVNTGYCATKGIPLGYAMRSEAERERFEIAMGSACEQHGTPAPAKIAQKEGYVGAVPVFIQPVRPASTVPGAPNYAEPTNCRDCVYFVQPTAVKATFTWPVGLCLAKGNLVPPKMAPRACKGCAVGIQLRQNSPEIKVPSVHDFLLLPVYNENGSTPSSKARSTRKALPDPYDYVTDAPVKESHKARGIRAWRKIPHPHHQHLQAPYLPIFDPEFFSEDERALIPRPGDKYQPELYVDHSHLLHGLAVNYAGVGRTPVLIGPAGTGKTEGFVNLAYMTGLPFSRISISASSEVYDILGKHLVEIDPATGESVTKWVDGRVPKRYRLPGVLLVDEPNAGPVDVWQVFRPLTDNASQLVLDQDKGQFINKDPWCLFGMAMNPAWDPRYIGVNELNEADGNRLGAIWVDYPPEEVERDIIVNKCNASGYEITNDTLDQLIKIGVEIRRMGDPNSGGEISVSWGVRLSVAMALYSRFLTLSEAANMTIGDRLDPPQRELILAVVRDFDAQAGSGGS